MSSVATEQPQRYHGWEQLALSRHNHRVQSVANGLSYAARSTPSPSCRAAWDHDADALAELLVSKTIPRYISPARVHDTWQQEQDRLTGFALGAIGALVIAALVRFLT